MIQGNKSKLTRATHGITYDPARDLLIASEPLAGAIVTFPAGASGEVAPLRVIQGPETHIHRPYQEVVDDVHHEIDVADNEGDSVLVFPWDANGNQPPLRVIEGPNTGMREPVGIGVDPVRNLIVVAADGGTKTWQHNGGLFIFKRTDNGNVAPLRVIAGPHTGMKRTWHMALYQDKIYVAVTSSTAATGGYVPPYDRGGYAPRPGCTGPPRLGDNSRGFIGVWKITDSGDVPPEFIIRGDACPHPGDLAINPAKGEIYTGGQEANGMFTFLVPQFFSSGS